MKIDTEKIKNKKFTGPIEAKLQKYSQEYRVLATLKYLFPNRFKKIVKEESPDLQDKENGIGIEVTVAVDWRDLRAAREFANLQQENRNIEKHKKAITSSGYFFLPIKKDKVAICTSGTSKAEKFFFKKVYEKRLTIFSNIKQDFKKLGFLLFGLIYQLRM